MRKIISVVILLVAGSAHAETSSGPWKDGEGSPPGPKPRPVASLRVPHCEIERDYRTRASQYSKSRPDMYRFTALRLDVKEAGHENESIHIDAAAKFYVCAKIESQGSYHWRHEESLTHYQDLYVIGEGRSLGFIGRIWTKRGSEFDGKTGRATIDVPIRKLLWGEKLRQFNAHHDINEMQIVLVARNGGAGGAYTHSGQIAFEGLRVNFDLKWNSDLKRYFVSYRRP